MAPRNGCKAMMATTAAPAPAIQIWRLQHLTRVSHLNRQPDPRPSTTPSHVGHSPAARYAVKPRTTHTHAPLTRTVRITRTHLTRMYSSPTGSGILSWAPYREAAHPPPHLLQRDPNTPRNCGPTLPSTHRAAREARAAPRATAPRFPQRHRTTAVFTVFWRVSFVSF